MTKLIIRTFVIGLTLSAMVATAKAEKSLDLDTVEIRVDLVQAHAKAEEAKSDKPLFEGTRTVVFERRVQLTYFCVNFIPNGKKATTDTKCQPRVETKIVSTTELVLAPAGSGGPVEINQDAISFVRNLNREAAMKNARARLATSQQLALFKSTIDKVMGKTNQPMISTINPDEL